MCCTTRLARFRLNTRNQRGDLGKVYALHLTPCSQKGEQSHTGVTNSRSNHPVFPASASSGGRLYRSYSGYFSEWMPQVASTPNQPWSSGKVGTIGGSYFGATQWLAATQSPEALQAMAPFVTAADYHEGWDYQDGAFELGFNLSWTVLFLAMGELQRRVGAAKATLEDPASEEHPFSVPLFLRGPYSTLLYILGADSAGSTSVR